MQDLATSVRVEEGRVYQLSYMRLMALDVSRGRGGCAGSQLARQKRKALSAFPPLPRENPWTETITF
jgi:hypothetical protein